MDEKRLRSVPLFAGLAKRDRQLLARNTDEVSIDEGRHLVNEGEFAWSFFVIEEGTAKVERGGEHVADLAPGDFFGEVGVLESTVRTASVTATSGMELIVLTRAAVRTLRRDQPAVADRLADAVRQRWGNDAG